MGGPRFRARTRRRAANEIEAAQAKTCGAPWSGLADLLDFRFDEVNYPTWKW